MVTDNAVECGAVSELGLSGMLRCKFNSHNQICAVELVFDVMGFMHQLQSGA